MKSSKYKNPYMFQGRRYDAWTGLYYFRNRYYDPETGRFTTRDPKGPDSLGNLYAFVNNSPYNYVDPWGLEAVTYDQLMSGFMKKASKDEIGQLILYLSEGNKITLGDVLKIPFIFGEPDFDRAFGFASTCEIQIEEDKGLDDAIGQLREGLNVAVEKKYSRDYVEIKRIISVIRRLEKYYNKFRNSNDRDKKYNALRYLIIANSAKDRYFGGDKAMHYFEAIEEFSGKAKGFIDFVTKLDIDWLGAKIIDVNFEDIRDGIELYMGSDFSMPGENFANKIIRSNQYRRIASALRKGGKYIGRILLIKSVYDIQEKLKGIPTPEDQMSALKDVWDLSSGIANLDKICPGYGTFVSEALSEVSKNIKVLKWKMIEHNLRKFKRGQCPVKKDVEFSGEYVPTSKIVDPFKEWR